jgi:hypothetical protein
MIRRIETELALEESSRSETAEQAIAMMSAHWMMGSFLYDHF